MAKELNEDTGFNVSIKTLIGIGFAMATIISMWFMLQADIAEAKELPAVALSEPPPINPNTPNTLLPPVLRTFLIFKFSTHFLAFCV